MPNKDRVLFLLQLLQEQSDEGQPLNTTDIRRAFQKEGCPATVQTIRNDIKTLREAGFQIISHERNGVATAYCYTGRPFEPPELQILVDAVSSAQFITNNRSKTLIRKLSDMSGPSQREELQPGILVSERTANSKITGIVQKIKEGIRENKKISFKYYDYNAQKQLVARHQGENYFVSPYATLWKNDRYYLIGYSDKHQDVATFRVDRMETPRLLTQACVPQPEDFDLQSYAESKFKMFGGREEMVTLLCKNSMANHIIDAFGRDTEFHPVGEEYFEVTVPVSVSMTFFSWLMQYAGQIAITAPESVRQAYADSLKKALLHIEQI